MGRLSNLKPAIGMLRPSVAYMPEGRREYDRHRDQQAWRRWYKTARWRRIRKAQLDAEPLCRMCCDDGRVTAATVCDHVAPHRGDEARFWGGPFQSLCKACHDGPKQRAEQGRS